MLTNLFFCPLAARPAPVLHLKKRVAREPPSENAARRPVKVFRPSRHGEAAKGRFLFARQGICDGFRRVGGGIDQHRARKGARNGGLEQRKMRSAQNERVGFGGNEGG